MTHFLGERVRALRQARGLRVRDVAGGLAIPASQLSRIERGLNEADGELIRRFATYFGEAEDELLLLAGRLPADLQAILQQHPAESALVLREHFVGPSPASRPAAPFLPNELVSAISGWAVRAGTDVVLDPNCGDGTWLAAAGTRLLAVGASPAAVAGQLHGYDTDAEACARAMRRIRSLAGGRSPHIQCEDFLRVAPRARLPFQPSGPPAATVVLGLVSRAGLATAGARQHARRIAAEAGIELPESAPPWAALVVHAASFVRPEGRFALVAPAALLHAHYAANVRSYLAQLFPALRVVTFERPLPGIGEVVVLLGDADGEPGVHPRRVADPAGLATMVSAPDTAMPRVAEASSLRWSGASLPTPSRALLQSLRRAGVLRRLGDLGRIDAGLVTGANRFFVLNAAGADHVAAEFLQPALLTASTTQGLIFRHDDWEARRRAGHGCFLLCIPPRAVIDPLTQRYLEQGQRDGIPERATCRRRPVWYALPAPARPAAFLTYLCPGLPRMLLNEAKVTHANVLHSVQPRPGVTADAVALSFMSTAALLGCELLGRHYGNGVLKLEPNEAENLLVPDPTTVAAGDAAPLLREADNLWRHGREAEATAVIDQYLLGEVHGLEARTVQELRHSCERERELRRAPARTGMGPKTVNHTENGQ